MTKVYSRPVPSHLMNENQLKTYYDIRDFAESKGWLLLSDRYLDSRVPLLFLCPNSHEVGYYLCNFKTKKDYTQCTTCVGKQATVVEAINTSLMTKNQQKFYTEICDLASVHSWTMVSEKFTTTKDHFLMLCPQGHEVKMYYTTFKYMEDYSKCRICIRNVNKIVPLEHRKLGPMNNHQMKYFSMLFNKCIDNDWDIISDRFEKMKFGMFFQCPNFHTVYCDLSRFLTKKDYTGCKVCFGIVTEFAEANFYDGIRKLNGIPLEKYTNSSTPTKCLCANGHECQPIPTSIRAGHGMCLICVNRSPISGAKNFYDNVASQGGYPLEPYINSRTSVLCYCSLFHLCNPIPGRINTTGYNICNRCSPNSTEVAQEKFEAEMERRGYQILEPYCNNYTITKALCNKLHEIKVVPSDVIRGNNYCLTCYPYSQGESKLCEALELLGISFIREHKFPYSLRRFDFLIPGINIEADGPQHIRLCGVYMPTLEDLMESQRIDREKMLSARYYGFRQLRMDYTWYTKTVEEIASLIIHSIRQFNKGYLIWVSSPSMYSWLDPSIISQPNIPMEIFNSQNIIEELKILFNRPIPNQQTFKVLTDEEIQYNNLQEESKTLDPVPPLISRENMSYLSPLRSLPIPRENISSLIPFLPIPEETSSSVKIEQFSNNQFTDIPQQISPQDPQLNKPFKSRLKIVDKPVVKSRLRIIDMQIKASPIENILQISSK